MKLIINKHVIDSPLITILEQLRAQTGYRYFNKIVNKGDNLQITCPSHKEGKESHPSCMIYNQLDGDLEFGFCHCFTCGYKASLIELVAYCFETSIDFAKEWLVTNFSNTFVEEISYITGIDDTKSTVKLLPETILEKYNYYHPYMWKRKLSKDIVDKFQIGYDKEREAITFPVWDERDRLKMITARCVENKKFFIDKGIEKPVYLLNEIIKENIDTCYVCESQINALYMWSLGKPAVALIGTGTPNQYKILNRCGVRRFILALDGDEAGDKGIKRFISNISDDKFIDILVLPRGKDVNDLSEEEINQLKIISKNDLKS